MNRTVRHGLALILVLAALPIGTALGQQDAGRTLEEILAELGVTADAIEGNEQMSREQVAAILARLAEAGGGNDQAASLPNWAQEYLDAAQEAGLTATEESEDLASRELFEDFRENFDAASFAQQAAYSAGTGSTF